jgi:hypothetical protein
MWLKGKFIHMGILLNVAAVQPRRRRERNSRCTVAYAIAAPYRCGGRAVLRLPAASQVLEASARRQSTPQRTGTDAGWPRIRRQSADGPSSWHACDEYCSRYRLARCGSRQVTARSSQIRPIRHIEYAPRRISTAYRAVDQPISADLVHIFFGRELTMILRLFAVERPILFSPPGYDNQRIWPLAICRKADIQR